MTKDPQKLQSGAQALADRKQNIPLSTCFALYIYIFMAVHAQHHNQ